MSAKPTGYGLMQIGGQPRPFLVGFEQADIFCRLLSRRNAADGGPMTLQDYNNLFNLVALRENKLLPADVYDFIYSALASGAVEDDLLLDYTPRIVGQWLGEAEDAEASKPLLEMVSQAMRRIERHLEREAKKAQAPAKSKPGPEAKSRRLPAR